MIVKVEKFRVGCISTQTNAIQYSTVQYNTTQHRASRLWGEKKRGNSKEFCDRKQQKQKDFVMLQDRTRGTPDSGVCNWEGFQEEALSKQDPEGCAGVGYENG